MTTKTRDSTILRSAGAIAKLVFDGTTVTLVVAGTTVLSATAAGVAMTGGATATLLPDVDNTYDLGSGSFQWNDVFYAGDLTPNASARVTGNLTPKTDSAYDLGTTALAWRVGYFDQLSAIATNHLLVNTISDDKAVRINSRSYAQVSGTSLGFSTKPAQAVGSTGTVQGGEISPRVNDTIACANIIGLHVDAYLKGTTGAVSGDVRGQQIELVTDDAGARTITGNVIGLRMRAVFSATAISSGIMVPFQIEKAEAQTNSQNWTALFNLTGKAPGVWNNDPATELNLPGGTVTGYIKCIVNGADRYIALYEKGNLAD